ncbi:hypothetical protein EAH77_20980 [Ewingella americana]|uniref:Uncharacterized protein n=1 Tax=Ewingella americana TaxID=41202 RepID=A0A502G8B7_9GAMM|nr:hypothetical protein EAH77_20980 [Ewingella americana]
MCAVLFIRAVNAFADWPVYALPEHSVTDNAIILAGIASLLNLYAKKFRCPDVLTSISPAINLCYLILSIPAERNNYDTQASDDCRRQWPEQ